PDVSQWPALLAADRDGSLNGANVTVGGLLLSVTPGDRKYGFVPLLTAQNVLHMENRVTEYAVGVEKDADLDRIKGELQAALGPDYDVKTWSEVLPFIKDLTSTQDKVFTIITNIFLFVVLLGIVNAMLMSVLERVREIGTMLAVGMRRRQITMLFLLEGAVLGAVGGALGVLLGAVIVTVMNHKGIPLPAPGATTPSIVKPFVPVAFLVRSLLFATVGAGLAALWPAWRASRLRPVEALAST
ncbi:MAG: ABC transporter permease, partial [Myxococcaceae bacterium]